MMLARDEREPNFVGRGGHKLLHALREFELDVTGMTAADLGCNVGGFTDCLLQSGAAHVVAVDTGYGALAWKLRQDTRVTVRERTNALHAEPVDGGVDLVVIDMGWTPQHHCIPAALRWLKPGGGGRIITLIKPHYEAREPEEKALLVDGVLAREHAERLAHRAVEAMPGLGADVVKVTMSPLIGGEGKKNAKGNHEYLALLTPRA